MALVVTFTGRTSIPAPAAGTGFKIWSYRIDPTGQGELQVGQRIAFGLPSAVDVQNPDAYPGVPQLAGTFLLRDPSSSRQYVGRIITSQGAQTLSFVAPAAESTCEVFLVKASSGQSWASLPFATSQGGTPAHVQVLTAPVVGPPVFNGRPVADFTGTLPYASEVFGVYQPLAGWFGAQNTLRVQAATGDHELGALSRESFSGAAARTLTDENLTALAERFGAAAQGVLSPVGLVNLFRQYFFEFDTFLGAPAGHLWISPGGTVEVVETSTRRTLVEKFAEQSEETSRKAEESLSRQDDVADAVKEENANDTKLGVSVTGGVNAPMYHADASASFSTQSTVKSSSEQTHKHTRTQSAKVSSEIKRNFKTTFKTVTETTDTSSRRYIVQNTTNELVNYELRRKMRKVGVQLQHIGTRLSWQVYFNSPGRDLGMGDLVNIVPAPDLTSLKPPEVLPPAAEKQVPFRLDVPFLHDAGPDDEAVETYTPHPDNIDRGVNTSTVGNDDTIQFFFEFPLPPIPAGYALSKIASIDVHGAQVQFTVTAQDMGTNPDPVKNTLKVRLTYANFQGKKSMPFDIVIVYTPTDAAQDAIDQINADAAAAYEEKVAELQRAAYGNAVRDRLRLVSSMRSRPPEDLRSEERQTVFGKLVHRLGLGEDPHLGSELIRQIFDVDEMLYFVAPDFWRPRTEVTHPNESSLGRYPVPARTSAPDATKPLSGATVAGWYSHTDATNALDPQGNATPEWRVNYLITEETQPAPLGSSLGWLIQIDGDERRNEFLNAAWAKVVLPVRPGHELDALDWLAEVEGEAALGLTYPFQPGDPAEYEGATVEEVLRFVAADLQESNTDIGNLLATEEVYETGFDPLAGGFRPAEPYQVFDQWVEILPTDQVAAVQVRYDPKTGQQL